MNVFLVLSLVPILFKNMSKQVFYSTKDSDPFTTKILFLPKVALKFWTRRQKTNDDAQSAHGQEEKYWKLRDMQINPCIITAD